MLNFQVHYFDVAYRLTWYCHCRKQELLATRRAHKQFRVANSSDDQSVLKGRSVDEFVATTVHKRMCNFFNAISDCRNNDRIHLVRSSAHRIWTELSRAEEWV